MSDGFPSRFSDLRPSHLHRCAVVVCDNLHANGDGGVCETCVEIASNHGAIECPSCSVRLCDCCGERPAWAVLGGLGSPLWSCENCMDEMLTLEASERDFQADPKPCPCCQEVSA